MKKGRLTNLEKLSNLLIKLCSLMIKNRTCQWKYHLRICRWESSTQNMGLCGRWRFRCCLGNNSDCARSFETKGVVSWWSRPKGIPATPPRKRLWQVQQSRWVRSGEKHGKTENRTTTLKIKIDDDVLRFSFDLFLEILNRQVMSELNIK